MANFEEHIVYGFGVSCAGSLLGYWYCGLTEMQSIAACIVGSLSSLAADLDHPEGVPGKILSEILIVLAPIVIFLSLTSKYKIQQLHVEHWIVIFCCAHLLIKHGTILVLNTLTTHRGIFHSLPAAVIAAEAVFLIFGHLALLGRITIAAIVFLGYLTHLVADEFYGVDWNRMTVKRSLGSALDLGTIRSLSTWVAYIVILILGCLIWHQCQPDSKVIAAIFNYLQKIAN